MHIFSKYMNVNFVCLKVCELFLCIKRVRNRYYIELSCISMFILMRVIIFIWAEKSNLQYTWVYWVSQKNVPKSIFTAQLNRSIFSNTLHMTMKQRHVSFIPNKQLSVQPLHFNIRWMPVSAERRRMDFLGLRTTASLTTSTRSAERLLLLLPLLPLHKVC